MKCYNCEKWLEEHNKEEGYENIFRCDDCGELTTK